MSVDTEGKEYFIGRRGPKLVEGEEIIDDKRRLIQRDYVTGEPSGEQHAEFVHTRVSELPKQSKPFKANS